MVIFGVATWPRSTVLTNSLVLEGESLVVDSIAAGIPAVPVKNWVRASRFWSIIRMTMRTTRIQWEKVKIPKRLGIIAIICLLVVAAALGAGLGVGLVSSKDNPLTDPILEKEDMEQHQRLHTMYHEQFFDIVGESIVKEGTPESHAAVWIISQDGMKLPVDAPNLVRACGLLLQECD